MTEAEELAYERGQRAVWVSLLQQCLKMLGYDSQEANPHRWIIEREQAVAQLRILCADFGDNRWDDDLHLADVIDKYLGNELHRRYGDTLEDDDE